MHVITPQAFFQSGKHCCSSTSGQADTGKPAAPAFTLGKGDAMPERAAAAVWGGTPWQAGVTQMLLLLRLLLTLLVQGL